jgi:hypothetical protein
MVAVTTVATVAPMGGPVSRADLASAAEQLRTVLATGAHDHQRPATGPAAGAGRVRCPVTRPHGGLPHRLDSDVHLRDSPMARVKDPLRATQLGIITSRLLGRARCGGAGDRAVEMVLQQLVMLAYEMPQLADEQAAGPRCRSAATSSSFVDFRYGPRTYRSPG